MYEKFFDVIDEKRDALDMILNDLWDNLETEFSEC